MNVAKKSTAKLPQNWRPQGVVEEESKNEEDSGVGSADSLDFQDALLNLKALSGVPEVTDTDRSELKDLQTVCSDEKKNLNVESSSPTQNGDERDILDQIDDIVNDGKTETQGTNGASELKTSAALKEDQDSEEDDILVLNADDKIEAKKEKTSDPSGSKGKVVPGNNTANVPKNALNIGEKVRSTVHNIMSKFVQNNPVANSLLVKVKSEDTAKNGGAPPHGGSGASSPVTVRQDKGNLFDNLALENDVKSPAVESNQCRSLQTAASMEISSVTESVLKDASESAACEVSESSDTKDKVDESQAQTTAENSDIGDKGKQKETAKKENTSGRVDGDKTTALPCNTETASNNPELASDDAESKTVNEEEVSLKEDPSDSKENQDGSKELSRLVNEAGDCKSGDVQEEKIDTSEISVSDNLTAGTPEDLQNTHADPTPGSDRKRQHSQDCGEQDGGDLADPVHFPKRSRLDGLIGMLGKRVIIPSEAPDDTFEDEESTPDVDSFTTPGEMDSVDTPGEEDIANLGELDSVATLVEEDTSTTPGEVDSITTPGEDTNTTPGEVDSLEKQSEETSAMTSDEEEDEKSSDLSGKIILTKKELEKLIVATATAAIQRHHSQEILNLTRRVEEYKQSSDEWRAKAKDLQSQMLDLTVLQQKLDKRKAHAAALKSITTRSIGVGVTEDRLRTTTPQKVTGNKTPPATPPATHQTQPAWGQTAQRVPTPGTQSTPAHNTSVAHLLSQTARLPTVASCQAATKSAAAKSLDTVGRVPLGIPLNPRPPSANIPSSNVVLINSSGLPVATKASQPLAANSTPKAAAIGSSKDLIDLTMEDDAASAKQANKQVPAGRPVASQQVVRHIAPTSQGMQMVGSTSTIVLSGGAQLVSTNNGPRPGMLQVVSIPNGQAGGLKPGQFVTVMPGQSGSLPRLTTALTSNSGGPRLMSQPVTMQGMRLVQPQMLQNNARITAPGNASASARLAVPAVVIASSGAATTTATRTAQHPAALPCGICPRSLPPNAKPPAPKPGLKISRVKQGIVLSWNMTIPNECVEISTYQLYAYQETGTQPMTSLWKKVGDVNALALPMACTLTQFQDGNKYHFAVRAIDVYGRSGPFSDPAFIHLTKLP